MKTYEMIEVVERNKENTVGVLVYRDTIEEHRYDSNLSTVIVTKDFMKKYYDEIQKEHFDESVTADEWYYEIYTADGTEDFYNYAKEHNAIINVEHLDMESEIEEEIYILKVEDDCFGYSFGNGKGIFVQVVNYGEGIEYFIERNYVEDDNVFEPYGYNETCEFGNVGKCLDIIKNIYNEG